MTDELIARLRPGYELLSEGRIDDWLELLHPEVECRQTPEIIGTAQTFHGREGAREMMAELSEAWAEIHWEPVEVHELGGGRYLTRVRVGGTAKVSGIELEGDEISHILTVRDGLTTRIEAYRGWAAGKRAAGLA